MDDSKRRIPLLCLLDYPLLLVVYEFFFFLLLSLRVTILCRDGAFCFVFLSDGDCGKGQTVWLPTAFFYSMILASAGS